MKSKHDIFLFLMMLCSTRLPFHFTQLLPLKTDRSLPCLALPYQALDVTPDPKQQPPTPPLPTLPPESPNVNLRRFTRSTKTTSYLRDFHCNFLQNGSSTQLPSSNTRYPLSTFLSYDSLSSSDKSIVLAVSSEFELQYHQAVSFSYCYEAMKANSDAMESNNTYSIVRCHCGNIQLAVSGIQDQTSAW